MRRAIVSLLLIVAVSLAGLCDVVCIPDTVSIGRMDSVPSKLPLIEIEDDHDPSAIFIAEVVAPDTLQTLHGTYAENDWRYRLIHRNISLNDRTIHWPRFINFCLGIYRWADNVFNSQDTTYVHSHYPPGKALIISDNWLDSYLFEPHKVPRMGMMGTLYANLGVQLKYSILSIGRSFDMNSLLSSNPIQHSKWNFGISCARFNIELNLWRNNGGTFIRHFGKYNNGNIVRIPFQGLTLRAMDIMGIYFFDNRRFSFGATHSYGHNQRVSHGSAVIGFDISRFRVDFDFDLLPEELKEFYPYPLENYRIHYRAYHITSGYSYNWVINRHFTFNISAFPGLGVTSTREKSKRLRPSEDMMLSFSVKGMAALLYCQRNFFFCLKGNYTGNFFHSDEVKLLTNIQNYQFVVGLRF